MENGQLYIQTAINGVFVGFLYAGLACGFTLCYSANRVFHLAYGVVFSLSGYVLYSALEGLGAPLAVSIAAAAVIACTANVAVFFMYDFMGRIGASPIIMMIAALGLLVVGNNVLSLAFGFTPIPLKIEGISDRVLMLGGYRLLLSDVVAALLLAVVLVVVVGTIRLTRWGLFLRAVFDDPNEALVVGVPVLLTQAFAFVISALFIIPAVLAQGLRAAFDPNMGFDAVLIASTAMIIGGLSSVPAAFAGGLILGIARSEIGVVVGAEWQTVGIYLLFGAVLLICPSGLFGQRAIR
jgi:branched-chain amino acid transport system permease protein